MKTYVLLSTLLMAAGAAGCTTDKNTVDEARRQQTEDRLNAERHAEEKVNKAEDKAEEQTEKAYDKADAVAIKGDHDVKEAEDEGQADVDKTERKGAIRIAKAERKAYIDQLEHRLTAQRDRIKDLEKSAGDTGPIQKAQVDERRATDELSALKKADARTWDSRREAADAAFARVDDDLGKVRVAH